MYYNTSPITYDLFHFGILGDKVTRIPHMFENFDIRIQMTNITMVYLITEALMKVTIRVQPGGWLCT